MANRYWVGGTASWDATAGTKWATTSGGAGGEAVPTAADDVFLDGSSGTVTVTISAAASCRSLNCTGFTGTLSQGTQALNIGDATAGASNIAFKMVPTMTYSVGTGTTTLQSTSATQQTIETGTRTMGHMTINGANSSYIFTDNYTNNTGRTLTVTEGTLDANGYNVNAGKVQLSLGSNPRTLTMGTGTWTLTSTTGGNVWYALGNLNLTLNTNTSTIVINDAGGSTKTFNTGFHTYNNLSITGGGAGVVVFNTAGAGTVTFNTFTINAPKTVTFNSGATIAASTFNALGTLGNIITINAHIPGSAAILSKSSGTVSCDYLSLQDSTATGGATWYAGANSTNVSGNSGWIFTAPPSNTGNFLQLFS